MTIEEIHFVLDSFMHFMPEDEVEDFVRGLVGKRVMLMPNDDNAVDRMCIDGFVGGVACCHVSARKAALVREYMRRKGARSLMVQVESHNLDKGYKTAFCRVVPDIELNDDFIVEHSRRFLEWKYDGCSNIAWCRHRELWANTDYLLMRLDADDATEEELVPVIEHYVPMLPLAFSKEDKENCIKVNVMLQNSRIAGASEWNAKVVEVLDFLNHSDKRTETVRRWLDDLKLSAVCRREADGIKATKLEEMTSNLNDFPDGLFACYKRDFVTFCGNLYYNRIPSAKLQEFMNGIAVYELVRERMAKEQLAVLDGMARNCKDEDEVGRLLMSFVDISDEMDSETIKGQLLVLNKYNIDHGHRFDAEIDALYGKLGFKSKVTLNAEEIVLNKHVEKQAVVNDGGVGFRD